MNGKDGQEGVTGTNEEIIGTATPRELYADAGEYVIGTLDAAERALFEVRLEAGDAVAREAVAFWQRNLGTLDASIAAVEPPASLRAIIEAALPPMPDVAAVGTDRHVANDNRIAAMQRSRGRWRAGALAAGIVACVMGALAFDDTMRARFLPEDAAQQLAATPATKDDARVLAGPGERFVAVVTAAGDQPALVVTVDTGSNQVSVRALGVETPAQRSLELWYVADGASPVSLGLVGTADLRLPDASPEEGSLLAVSVEPVGGSTTGGPSGPVVYSGKLVPDDSASD